MKNGIALSAALLVGAGVPTIRAAAPIGETITLYSAYVDKYVEVQPANGNELAANIATALTATEQFLVEDAGGGKIRLKALYNNLYVQLTGDVKKLKAVGTSATDVYSQWLWVEGSGGIINLKSVGNNNYVTPNNGGTLKAGSGSIGAATEFTWELAGGGAGTWRVIPKDDRWPSDDTIVALCEVTDPEFNLPADPVNTDCTAAFQAAVDACAAVGGGTVFVPEGQYKLDGPLTVPTKVFLRGRWRELHAGDSGDDLGTVIRCEQTSLPSGVINFQGDGGVYEMTFWHPNQKPANGVTVYPTVIMGGSTHKNVTFLNAYEAIRLPGSSNDRIRGLYGSPLNMGLFSGPAFAVPGFTDINFSPDYLAWSGLETDPAQLAAHADYMYNYGTAMQHDGKAAFYANDYTISGYNCGVRFSNEQPVSNTPHGDLVKADISYCKMGIQFVTGQGVDIKNCNIHECLDAINTTVWSDVKLNQSTISGINYDVNANSASPNVIQLNSTLSGDPGKLKLNAGEVIVKDLRPEPARRVYDDYVRKPLKEDLFNVKASQYGAVGNGVTDDTAAILAAVADANANGGGIVFFPAGDYLIKQNLTLSPGVELRGCLGGRVQVEGSSDGSTLRVDVPVGDEFGQAFITMGDYCGIRGMAFFYPNQTAGGTTGAFVKHPFTVRANGIRNYIIACSPINPYRFVEFNGDDNLFMFSYPCAIRENVRSVNNRNGRYEDNMGKVTHWPNSSFPCPLSDDKDIYKDNCAKEGIEVFHIVNCDEYNIDSSFWHGSFRGAYIDNSGGDFGKMQFEQCEQYMMFVGGSKHAIIDGGGAQERRWGPVDDPDSFGIKLCEGFTGTVESYNGNVSNEPYEMWDVQGGSLYVRASEAGSHSHGAVLTIRTGVNGSLFLEGAEFQTLAGIENNGSLKMLNCSFGAGIYQPFAEQFGADNTFTTVNVLSDPGQNPVRDYGLVLDQSNVVLEYPSSRKNLTYATTTDGQFNLTVDDPAFLNESPNSVYLYCEWIVSSGTTVRVSFYGDSGWQVAGTVTFTEWKDTFTKFKLNNPVFGQQGTGYPDIRLEVLAGNSPKIRSFELQTAAYAPVAPKAPTGLAATGGASVALDWDDNAEPGVTYNVYRREAASGAFGIPVETGIADSYYEDALAAEGTNYYVVTAVDSAGRESGISETVSGLSDSVPPVPPTGLVATGLEGAVDLDWDDNTEPDLLGYGVWRGVSGGSNYYHIQDVAQSAYVDTGLTNGITYQYVVTALDGLGNESVPSASASATPIAIDTEPPSPNPSTWEVVPTAISMTEITMTATTATDSSGGVQYRFLNTTTGQLSLWQSSPTCVWSGLEPGSNYTFRVKTQDALGNTGSYSAEASATTFADWSVISSDNFDAGWGNWVSGGSDAFRAADPDSGSQSLDIQDNSGDASSAWLVNSLDLTGVNELKIEFTYLPKSMESGEDFWVQYSDDGGTSWTTVKAYASGVDFTNGVRENPVVTLDSGSYSFSSNVKLKFRCDASGKQDDIYIDDVVISVR